MASTITLTVTQTVLEKMQLHYSNQIIKIPNHTLFQAKTKNCTITAYLSKKVVFQGQNPEAEVALWDKAPAKSASKPATSSGTSYKANKTAASSGLPSQIATLAAIGCDEVGTGDYLGPIVICCAYVNDDLISKLLQMGVKDSKALHDSQIVQLSNQLKQEIPYQCIVLPNEKYNLLVEKGMNANSIKAYVHNKALGTLVQSFPNYPQYIVMDEFVNGKKYFDYLQKLNMNDPIIKDNLFFVQKGESVHVAVAAASIIARGTFVEYMEELSQKLNFDIPKGAGPQVDRAGAQIIQRYDIKTLERISKWHFANTKKIMK